MPSILLSETTYRRLHSHAISFDDGPEDVIVRLLDKADDDGSGRTPPSPDVPRPARTARATPGSLLPLTAYWVPILRILDEAGGAAPSGDVLEALDERMGDMFTKKDREQISSGAIRWRNRARFARLRMKERNLLSGTSQHGVWEITDEGREYLAQSEQG
jgi:hypothetical protein